MAPTGEADRNWLSYHPSLVWRLGPLGPGGVHGPVRGRIGMVRSQHAMQPAARSPRETTILLRYGRITVASYELA